MDPDKLFEVLKICIPILLGGILLVYILKKIMDFLLKIMVVILIILVLAYGACIIKGEINQAQAGIEGNGATVEVQQGK